MHVARLRCQTWHVWPEKAVIEASPFALDVGSGTPIPAQLAVLAYLNRMEPAAYIAEQTEIGPLMWTGTIPGLYTVRESVLKAPEDTINLVIEHKHPCRGEVDLAIAFRYGGEPSVPALEAIRCTLFAIMSLLNLKLGDFLTPVAPMQVRREDENRQIKSSFTLTVRDRRHLQTDELGSVITELAEELSRSPNAEKLRSSLELYGSHFFERQARTRFLLLVIALETLAIPTPKHQVALSLLDKWKTELFVEMARHADGGAEYASLEALSRELLHRRDDSIRSQIRMLFRSAAEAKGEDPVPLERRALRVYDIRSTLVHDGSLAPGILGNAEGEARVLLEYLFSMYARLTFDEASAKEAPE